MVGLGVLGVVAAVLVARGAGLADLTSRLADPSSGGLALVLVLGLTAGVSTCMALVGGLVLAVSASHAARLADTGGATTFVLRMRPHVAFGAGRIVGFGLLGALLGALGAGVSLPGQVTGTLLMGVAALMLLLGLRLAGVSPRLAAWTVTLPGGLGRMLGVDPAGAGSYSDVRAAALGACTFFLPCGFTQAVQLYALSTASPVSSGLIMATFSIGTTPGLLVLAGVPEVATGARRDTVLRVVGVVVVAFALLNASAGRSVLGIDVGVGRAAASSLTVSSHVTVSGGVQTVRMTQTPDGYTPADTVVYAGMPIRGSARARPGNHDLHVRDGHVQRACHRHRATSPPDLTHRRVITDLRIQIVEKIAILKNPATTLLCDVNSVMSCTDVLNAWQSSVLGPPNALIGAVMFALLGSGAFGAVLGNRVSRAYLATLWAWRSSSCTSPPGSCTRRPSTSGGSACGARESSLRS